MVIYLQMIDTPEERSKFEQLYIHYRGLMYYVSFKILNNEQDAECRFFVQPESGLFYFGQLWFAPFV